MKFVGMLLFEPFNFRWALPGPMAEAGFYHPVSLIIMLFFYISLIWYTVSLCLKLSNLCNY